MNAVALLRRAGIGRIVGICTVLAIGIAMTTCLLGVPIAMFALDRLLVAIVRGDSGDEPKPSRWTGPAAFALGSAMVVIAILAFRLAEEPSGSLLVGLVAALVAAGFSGAALGPLWFAPFAFAEGAPSLSAGLARGFDIAARLGALRVAILGVMSGFLVVFGIFACGLACQALAIEMSTRVMIWILSAPIGVALVAPWIAAKIAAAHLAVPATKGAAVPGLRALAVLLIPGVLACVAAIAVAAATPTPMDTIVLTPERGLHPPIEVTEQRLPDTSVTARITPRGVLIEADDGGGAGELACDTGSEIIGDLLIEPGDQHGGPPDSFAVINHVEEMGCITIVDRDGVRLDDGLDARVVARLGTLGLALLAVALALMIAIGWQLAREIGSARTIDAPKLDGKGGTLAALACVVRLSEDSRCLEADGGAIRLRLPEAPKILGVPAAIEDGTQVMLISRFTRGVTAGLREAFAEWPADGALVLGDREVAATALVARAAKRAAWLAAPALACMLAASVLLLARIGSES